MSKMRLLSFVVMLLCVVGCDKNDCTGELSVSFVNTAPDLVISIYSINNENIPILEKKINGKYELTLPLNEGDYILLPYSSSVFYNKMGFQILHGKTTSIHYDSNNSGKVED